jgi:hypothetical protein
MNVPNIQPNIHTFHSLLIKCLTLCNIFFMSYPHTLTKPEPNWSLMDPGYIKPSLQNFLLTDLDTQALRNINENLAFESPPQTHFPGSFPVEGIIWSQNARLMVKLVCKTRKDSVPRSILFVVITGSPYTYLCQEAMASLIGTDCRTTLSVELHTDNVIQLYVSPKDSDFAGVNVLGMDYLAKNKVNLRMDYPASTFSIGQ